MKTIFIQNLDEITAIIPNSNGTFTIQMSGGKVYHDVPETSGLALLARINTAISPEIEVVGATSSPSLNLSDAISLLHGRSVHELLDEEGNSQRRFVVIDGKALTLDAVTEFIERGQGGRSVYEGLQDDLKRVIVFLNDTRPDQFDRIFSSADALREIAQVSEAGSSILARGNDGGASEAPERDSTAFKQSEACEACEACDEPSSIYRESERLDSQIRQEAAERALVQCIKSKIELFDANGYVVAVIYELPNGTTRYVGDTDAVFQYLYKRN